jgi:hypothetical protein
MAFRYHSILKCGTDGGSRENDPEMLICGSLIGGRLHEKLNALFRELTTLVTALLACSIGRTIASLIPFHTDDAVERIPSNADEIELLSMLTALLTVLLIELQDEEIADLIPFIAFVTVDLIEFHEFEIAFLIPSITDVVVVLIEVHAEEAAVLIAESAVVVVFLIEVHAFKIPLFMASYAEVVALFTPSQAV